MSFETKNTFFNPSITIKNVLMNHDREKAKLSFYSSQRNGIIQSWPYEKR